MFTPFTDLSTEPSIRGFLHEPPQPNGNALVLTHGAGGNCQSKLLVAVAEAFADAGFAVLRFDLPFRNDRRFGPPSPGSAARDRDGLRRAAKLMKARPSASATKRSHIFLGGHSYGGRQATILASEEPQLAGALLLLAYPLHPPNKATQLRTSHFPKLTTPAFFVHGTRDPFATTPEMESALQLIPGPHTLLEVEAAGHDLLTKKTPGDLPLRVAREFQAFVAKNVT